VRRALDDLKARSGLTWHQVADAMNVDARAIYLWKRGGGISAGRHERLEDMVALINTLYTGDPLTVRAELLEALPGGSLLDRLRRGATPHEVAPLAPWRAEAVEALERNLGELNNDGILDEDFAFLLNMSDADIERFGTRAAPFLEGASQRRAWERFLDLQIESVHRPRVVEVDDEPDVDDEPTGIRPLFNPDELGIQLGVGAIASSRPLYEGR
jgi:hypothetical protein